MYCTECGTELEDDAVFCTNCGTRVAEFDTEEEQEEPVMVNDMKYGNHLPPEPQKTITGSSPVKKVIVSIASVGIVLGGVFFAQQQGIINLPFLTTPDQTGQVVSESKDVVSLESKQEAAEASVNEEIAETAVNEEIAETAVNEEMAETAVNEEIAETAVNEEMAESSVNAEAAESSVNVEDTSASENKVAKIKLEKKKKEETSAVENEWDPMEDEEWSDEWDPMEDEASGDEWNPMEDEASGEEWDQMEDDKEVEEIMDADDIYNFYDGVAQSLSTTNYANAMDGEWAIDYIFYGGENQGRVITDPSLARKISGDMQPLLNGGWKAYMFSADSGYYDRDWERYLSAWIATIDSEFKIRLDWKYVYNAAQEQTIEEDGKDLFKGTFDAANGTAKATGDYASIEIEEFYVNENYTAEYALGTFYWASGEKYHIALMRAEES